MDSEPVSGRQADAKTTKEHTRKILGHPLRSIGNAFRRMGALVNPRGRNRQSPSPDDARPQEEPEAKPENPLAAQFFAIRQDVQALTERIRNHTRGESEQDKLTLINPSMEEMSGLAGRYEELAQEILANPQLQRDLNKAYVHMLIEPAAIAKMKQYGKSIGEQKSFREGLRELVEHETDPVQLRDNVWEFVQKSAGHIFFSDGTEDGFSNFGTYSRGKDPTQVAIKQVIMEFARGDFVAVKQALEDTFPEDREALAIQLHEAVSLRHGSRGIHDITYPLEGHEPITFRETLGRNIVIEEEHIIFYSNYVPWFQVMRASPELQGVFGKAFDQKDNQIAAYLQNWGSATGTELLKFYPTPGNLKSLIIDLTEDNPAIGNSGTLYSHSAVSFLAEQDGWVDALGQMVEKYPDLAATVPVLQKWNSPGKDRTYLLRKAASNFIVGVIKDAEAHSGQDPDFRGRREFLDTAYRCLSAEAMTTLLLERGEIKEDAAEKIQSALRIVEETVEENRVLFDHVLVRKLIGKLAPRLVYNRPVDLSSLITLADVISRPEQTREGIGNLSSQAVCESLLFTLSEDIEQLGLPHIKTLLSDFAGQSNIGLDQILKGYQLRMKREPSETVNRDSIFSEYHTQLRMLFANPVHLAALKPLLESGGPLHSNTEKILIYILTSKNILRSLQETIGVFTRDVPYWKQLFLFMDARIGDKLATAISEYPIDAFPRIKRAKGGTFDFSEDFTFDVRSIKAMSVQQKRAIADFGELSDAEIATTTVIPFASFRGEYKKIIVAYLIQQTIERSRDEEKKQIAHERNYHLSQEPLRLKEGMYIHGTYVDFLGGILRNGNLSGEALGESAKTDGIPFHVDFARINSKLLREYPSTRQRFSHNIAHGYSGWRRSEGQIFLLYDRENPSVQPQEYFAGRDRDDYALVLGGMPATEISGVVLPYPDTTMEKVKNAIIENGFYIPVYDMDGNLHFPYEEYERGVAMLKESKKSFSRDALDQILTGDGYSPQALVDFFKQRYLDEYIKPWKGEGDMTTEIHTVRGLGQFDKYFSGMSLSTGISEEFFRVCFALHDIGKKHAIESGDRGLQHVFTQMKLDEILPELDYSEQERKLARALIFSDYLGEAIQNPGRIQSSVDGIRQSALEAGVDPVEFFDLLTIYYRIDAGSYTRDAGGEEMFDHLFLFNPQERKLEFVPAVKNIVDKIRIALGK